MSRRLLWTAYSLTALGLMSGCASQRCCQRPYTPTCPSCNRCTPGPAPQLLPPHPLTPYQSVPVAPAPAVGVAPPAPTLPPAGSFPPAPGPAPTAPGATLSPNLNSGVPNPPLPGATEDVRRYGPTTQPEPNWRPPASGGARLAVPEPAAPAPEQPSIRLQSPVTEEPPLAPNKPDVREERSTPAKPNVAEERSPSPALPVGIPQFAVVQDRVTTGLKPSLDGFEWLQANGYRTIVHLLRPGEEDSARKEIERRGFTYIALEVSPKELATVVEKFNRIVADTANPPLFVYDKDGLLAGALWYLHFRTADRLPDEEARRKAVALGLREETAGEVGTLWVAIQEYVRKNLR